MAEGEIGKGRITTVGIKPRRENLRKRVDAIDHVSLVAGKPEVIHNLV